MADFAKYDRAGSNRANTFGPDCLNAELTGPGVAATTRPDFTQNRRGDTGVRLNVVLRRGGG